MTTDAITIQVRNTIEAFTADEAEAPIELLFVGERSVWLVLNPDCLEGDLAMIEVFRALDRISGVETLYVERVDRRADGG